MALFSWRTKRTALLLFLLLLLVLVTGCYLMTPGEGSAGAPFVIAEGESAAGIATRLSDEGYVRSRFGFRLALLWSGDADRLQPGEHDLSGSGSYGELIERLTRPPVGHGEVTLLLREGESLRHLKTALNELDLAYAAEDLYELAGQPATVGTVDRAVMRELKKEYSFLESVPDGLGLEGFLFPDTYRLFEGSSASDVIHRLLDNFNRRVMAEDRLAWPEDRSLFEVVTMASLLEREVRGSEDQRLVADIFWRRLAIGMALQADSTVNYAIDGDRPGVTHADTRVDSPYNTYLYPGLPVGPIGNPGLNALRAAVSPEPNDYWYFLTDSDGRVHYARTLEEHGANRVRYLSR